MYFIVVTAGGITNGQITAVSTAYSLNVATFVVITYDGSQKAAGVKFYLNGVLATGTPTEDTITGGPATSTIGVRTGGRTDGSTAFNDAAYIRVYNSILSQSQVSAQFALGPQ